MTSAEYRLKGNVLFVVFILIAFALALINFITAINDGFSLAPLIPAIFIIPAVISVVYFWIDDDRFMQPVAKLIFRLLNMAVYWNALMAIISQSDLWFLFIAIAIFYHFMNLKAVGCKFLSLQIK